MAYEIEVEERKPQTTISVRARTSQQNLPAVFGPALGRVAAYIFQSGMQPAGAPYAAYYNMDMQDLDVEMGFPVPKTLPASGDIQPGEIPAGTYASAIHRGPYSGLGDAYNALAEFCKARGHTMAGAAYEFYLNDPVETKPDDLLTQIAFLIA